MRGVTGGRTEALVALLAFAALFQLIGLVLGQDANWDQFNYHLSSVDSWLGGKPWSDYAVSQQQSWFNPLPEIPAWLIITGLPVRLAMIALALLPLTNAMATFAIARRFVFPAKTLADLLAALFCTFVGVTGTVHLVVVATSFAEAWLPSLVLLAFLALMHASESPTEASGRRSPVLALALAGLLLGLATGLKVTNAVYALGATIALVGLGRSCRFSYKSLLIFAAAGVAGFALGGGWWHLGIALEYGDPVFPMLSRSFHGPWIAADAITPESFRRDHWWQLFIDPFKLAVGDHSQQLSTVMPVRDARYAVGFYAAIGLVLLGLTGRARAALTPPLLMLGVLFLTSYVTWVVAFNIDRYALPLELIAATVAAALARSAGLLASRKSALLVFAALALVVVGSRPIKTSRIDSSKDWSGTDWFALDTPAEAQMPNTLYVMTGYAAFGWLTLFPERFGGNPFFVRVGGNLRIDPDTRLGRRIGQRIVRHVGPIRSLTQADEATTAAAELARFGLNLRPGTCVTIASKRPLIQTCALDRRLPGQQRSISTGTAP